MARRKPATTHGIAVVDKPPGVTSHDVVGMLRRRFGERQVGHAGTLDPDATGVLVVAVGKATRLLRFVEKTRKGYTGEIVLGTATSTLDAAGDVLATFDMSAVTIDDARRAVADHLVGDIEQVPPMVSAIRVDGKRLHELAREGIEVERAPRPVTIHRFDVIGLGRTGCAAPSRSSVPRGPTSARSPTTSGGCSVGEPTCVNLRRTHVGAFTLAEAGAPDECELLPVASAVRSLAVGDGR